MTGSKSKSAKLMRKLRENKKFLFSNGEIRNEEVNKKNICNVNSAAIDNNTTDNIGQKMCCKNTP